MLSAILGLFWMLSAQFIALPVILKKNPVAAWSLLFSCVLSWGHLMAVRLSAKPFP